MLDCFVTLVCWMYFTFGFLFLFSPFYVAAYLFSRQSEHAFQRLNRIFYQGFFVILKNITPRQKWVFDKDIADIRSSVVVCNHLSYLDPLVLISLLDRSKTVVKPVFFKVPIFGWVIRTAGYFPEAATKDFAKIMVKQMETLGAYLAGGGNLFIFPEGTRNRQGSIGRLNQGALKIARYCNAPIYVLCLRNTNRLFTPGKFFFRTREHTTISASIVDTIVPDQQKIGLVDLNERVHQSLERCMHENTGNYQTAEAIVSLPTVAKR